jgi:hypothetical protein
MTTETAAKLQKVKKNSASLRDLFKFFLVIGLVGWAVLAIAAWLLSPSVVQIGHLVYSGDAITPTVRVVGYVYHTLSVAIGLKATYHLMKLFALYAEGKIFSAENVRQIRQVGVAVLLFAPLFVLTLFVPLIAPGAEGSSPRMSAGAGWVGGAFESVISGTIILVVSWIMDVGRELREEQDLVV